MRFGCEAAFRGLRQCPRQIAMALLVNVLNPSARLIYHIFRNGIRHSAFQKTVNRAIYSFLEGTVPDTVTEDMVNQAGRWIQNINQQRHSDLARALPQASESCFTAESHIALLRERLERLSRGKALAEYED